VRQFRSDRIVVSWCSYMPQLETWFHYRNLDVSTLKELCRRWKPDLAKGFVKKSDHTALADIRESIAEELKYYREHFIRLVRRPLQAVLRGVIVAWLRSFNTCCLCLAAVEAGALSLIAAIAGASFLPRLFASCRPPGSGHRLGPAARSHFFAGSVPERNGADSVEVIKRSENRIGQIGSPAIQPRLLWLASAPAKDAESGR
jgi:hypothetical protein